VERLRSLDVGAILLRLVILGVGVYFFLKYTLGLSIPELNWDKSWALLVIALGIGILFSNLAGQGKGNSGQKDS
jgi:hypothetical protein